MKIYFRLLSFAKPIEKFAIPYVIATLLSILFGTFNLALLSPLFETLLNANKPLSKTPTLTDKAAESFSLLGSLRELVTDSIAKYSIEKTLYFPIFSGIFLSATWKI